MECWLDRSSNNSKRASSRLFLSIHSADFRLVYLPIAICLPACRPDRCRRCRRRRRTLSRCCESKIKFTTGGSLCVHVTSLIPLVAFNLSPPTNGKEAKKRCLVSLGSISSLSLSLSLELLYIGKTFHSIPSFGEHYIIPSVAFKPLRFDPSIHLSIYRL